MEKLGFKQFGTIPNGFRLKNENMQIFVRIISNYKFSLGFSIVFCKIICYDC